MESLQFGFLESLVTSSATKKEILVIGFDIGNEFSSVSFGTSFGYGSIQTLSDWNHFRSQSRGLGIEVLPEDYRVPTAISLPDSPNQPVQYGYQALMNAKGVHGHSEPKLLIATINGEPRAAQMLTEYIRWLWSRSEDQIRRRFGDFEQMMVIKAVVVVPDSWDQQAREIMFQTVLGAGVPGEIRMVSETEAAASDLIWENRETLNVNMKDNILVVYAGKTSVSCTTLQVTSLKPFSIMQIVPATELYASCGSGEITSNLINWIQQRIGPQNWSSLGTRKQQRTIRELNELIIPSFGSVSYDLEKNHYVTLRLPDDPSIGLEDEEIAIPSDVISRAIGDTFAQIRKVVDKQLREVYTQGLHVKAILVTGDFQPHKYLVDKLKDCYYPDRIEVVTTGSTYSIGSRGATRWGLETFAWEIGNTHDDGNAKG